MKIEIENVKSGDFVYCTGDSGFCHPSNEKVEKVTVQYDETDGKPYNVIWLSGGRKFDARHGGAMNPPTAYYIIPTEQGKAKAEHDKIDKEDAERKIKYETKEKEKEEILKKLTSEERSKLGL
jgi:hypothetical protein